MIKFKPTSVQEKVHSKILYNIIEGEDRIGQLEITLTVLKGFKQADVSWITPQSLAYKPSFKELVIEFAKKVSEEYDPVTEMDSVQYWVKK